MKNNCYNIKQLGSLLQCFFAGLLLLVLLLAAPSANANNETDAYKKQELTLNKEFAGKAWKNASDDVSYPKKKKVEKKKKEEIVSQPTTRNNSQLGNSRLDFKTVAQGLLIFLAILILAFVVFKAIAGDAILTNKQIERNRPIVLEDIEQNLDRADVESFLDKAIRNQEYRLAVRLYYLSIIKKLSATGAIQWKKDKTNGNYLNEMRKGEHPRLQEFRNVTRIFEYVWYSDTDFDGGKFEEVKTDFKGLLSAIK